MHNVAVIVPYSDLVYHMRVKDRDSLQINSDLLKKIKWLTQFEGVTFYILFPDTKGEIPVYSRLLQKFFIGKELLKNVLREKRDLPIFRIIQGMDLSGEQLKVSCDFWCNEKFVEKILFTQFNLLNKASGDICSTYNIRHITLLSSDVDRKEFSNMLHVLKENTNLIPYPRVTFVLDNDDTLLSNKISYLHKETRMNHSVLDAVKELLQFFNSEETKHIKTLALSMSARQKKLELEYRCSPHCSYFAMTSIAHKAAEYLEHPVILHPTHSFSYPVWNRVGLDIPSKAEHIYSLVSTGKLEERQLFILFDDHPGEKLGVLNVQSKLNALGCLLFLVPIVLNVLSPEDQAFLESVSRKLSTNRVSKVLELFQQNSKQDKQDSSTYKKRRLGFP